MRSNRHAITALREAQGWSMRELAARAGLHPSQISRAENGTQNLRPASLDAIARALGVDVKAISVSLGVAA